MTILWRNFFASASILLLAACATETPRGSAVAPVAPSADTEYRITAAQAGPVTPGTPFSKAKLQSLFPGKRVETIALATDAHTFYGFVVFDGGFQVMAAEPDAGNRTITAMHGVGPAVAGPNGEKIGMAFAQAGISPRNCKVGTNLWAGMAICPANHTPNVKLVFFDSSWGQPDGRLPPASELARGQLQRIVWTPPG